MGVDRRKLEKAIAKDDRVLLDTSTLIAYLNGGEGVTPVAELVVDDLVRSGRNPAVVSMVTVMELLVRPLRTGVPGGCATVRDFLRSFPNLSTPAVDLDVAVPSALAIAPAEMNSLGAFAR